MKTYYKKALLILVSCMVISCSASSNYTIEASPTNNTEISLQPNATARIVLRDCSLHQNVSNFIPIISINQYKCSTSREQRPFNHETLQTDGCVCRITPTETISDYKCRNIIIIIFNNGLNEIYSIKVQIQDMIISGQVTKVKAELHYSVLPADATNTKAPTTQTISLATQGIANNVPIIANNYSAIALFVALSVALGVIVLLVVLVAVLAHRLRSS